jgi:hypothetical protein
MSHTIGSISVLSVVLRLFARPMLSMIALYSSAWRMDARQALADDKLHQAFPNIRRTLRDTVELSFPDGFDRGFLGVHGYDHDAAPRRDPARLHSLRRPSFGA